MKKLIFSFGTRPEAIKLAPLILDAKANGFDPFVCLTGQHKELIEPVNLFFNFPVHANLHAMASGQSLHELTAKIVTGMEKIISDNKPAGVVVQGDTTSAFASALAAFYLKVPVIHIEAGLRTDQFDNPFPEEINRRLISRIASFHFAPTELAQYNLAQEGVTSNVVVTGNTGIDALRLSLERLTANHTPPIVASIAADHRIILATVHRRENFENLDQIFAAMLDITTRFSNVEIVLPVHMNPVVRAKSSGLLKNVDRIHLIEPLSYPQLIALMKASYLVLSDSGGLQEEAPYLGKPVLVLRTSTERQEGVNAGTSRIVGNTRASIVENTVEVLTNEAAYKRFQHSSNPYGDGYAVAPIYKYLNSALA